MRERDQAWVDAIRGGDEPAFEALFRHFYPELCSYASTYMSTPDEAREVVQDVFVRIWEHRDTWDVTLTVKAYLFRAVRNQSISVFRQDRKRRESRGRFDGEVDLHVETGYDALEYKELDSAYRNAVERLPERRRTAFLLKRQHGLTYAEIARVMGVSEGTVEVHISKALASLRKALSYKEPPV